MTENKKIGKAAREIMEDWPNIPLSAEEATLLAKLINNPVYHEVVLCYRGRRTGDNGPDEEPLYFGDICYWLDYEANYQNHEDHDGMFSPQAIASVNKWIRSYGTYPIRPFGDN